MDEKPERQEKRQGPPRGDRITAAELEKRISVVTNLIINGMRRKQMVEFFQSAENKQAPWGRTLPLRTLDRYIKAAHTEIHANAARDRDREMGKALLRLEELYRKANVAGQYNTARRIQHDISELTKILPGVKIEHGGRVQTDVTLPDPSTRAPTPEEQVATISTLFALAASRGAAVPFTTLATGTDPGSN